MGLSISSGGESYGNIYLSLSIHDSVSLDIFENLKDLVEVEDFAFQKV